MATCAALYDKYADRKGGMTADEARKSLAPYIDSFKLIINEQEIVLGPCKGPLSVIELKRICAIVDEHEQLYIVTAGCIYIMYKATAQIDINIRS